MFYQQQHFGSSEYFRKEQGENFSFPKHLHRSFELITVFSGSMTVTVDDREYCITPGEGVMIFPDRIHALESRESEHMLVIFSPDIVRAYSAKHAEEMPVNAKFMLPPYLIEQVLGLREGDSLVKMKAVLYSVCAVFDEGAEYLKQKNRTNSLLYDIFSFIDKNFDSDCSLERLSAALGYNGSYLSKYFTDVLGTSYISFVNQYRVSKACYLLSNTEKTILDCAYECGYRSLRSFNRNFKEYAGVTPSEYRVVGR